MKQYLENFLTDFGYPAEAAAALLCDYEKLCSSSQAHALFDGALKSYEALKLSDYSITNYKNDPAFDYDKAVEDAKAAGELSGIGEKSACLLFLQCMSRHLRELYRAKGIADEIWHSSMDDLRVKALECHTVYGVWGTFVVDWFDRFFYLSRFGLGRLQFEAAPYYADKAPYTKGGVNVRYSDDTVLGVHIPGGKRLCYDEVIDAYKRAYAFYGEALRYNGKLVIECSSWLLYPPYKEVFAPGSNLSRFVSDFDVLVWKADPDFHDCWRVYSKDWDGKAENLQRDTGMQRRFADYFAAGGVAGGGNGVIVFDGEKIINK